MIPLKDVTRLFITLHIEDEQILLILLAADGAVNRMGNATKDNNEKQLFIAQSSPEMFQVLKKNIKPETTQWEGRYSDSEPKGENCRLSVGFMSNDQKESICEFHYGSQSQGPPLELCELVKLSIEITEPWYQEQKQKISNE